jgi:hypothetical protein
MSLIYTCEMCQTSPFDYLTALHRQAERVAEAPHDWMPWNYKATIDESAVPVLA